MIGRLAPQGMTGEFYGLFALSAAPPPWMARHGDRHHHHGHAVQSPGLWRACCSSGARLFACSGGARRGRAQSKEGSMITPS